MSSDLSHHPSSIIHHPSLAYTTPDIPGVGGRIKVRPEDFLVEEQPLYELSGSGEHIYLFVEKRQLTTTDAVRRIAKAFGVNRAAVGFAGLKDKHAITRQLFSVHCPGREIEPQHIERIEYDRCRVLWHTRHANKLRTGHHAGNRFVIRIRDVRVESVTHAKRTLDQLTAAGIPNYVGPQRFGYRGNNHLLGRCLLLGQWKELLDELLGHPRDTDSPPVRAGREAYERGDFDTALSLWPRFLRHERQPLDGLRQHRPPRDVVLRMDPIQLDFMLSALQSAIFNHVLDARLRGGTFDRLLPGDLAFKHDNRAVFAVDEATAALENAPDGRIARHDVSPTGPLWGPSMMRPDGEPLRLERDALAAFDLAEEHFVAPEHGRRLEGKRRSLREFLKDPDLSAGVDEHGPYIRVAFELARGTFATIALREIMKNDASDTESADEQPPAA